MPLEEVKLPTKIRLVNPKELKAAAVNPRTHSPEQIKRIEASIREFGWTNPILTDAAGNVVAGHARQQAALNMGLAEVPVIDIGYLTPEQVRAYVIADNKLALDAGWDAAALKSELDALDKLGFDVALTGFSGAELDELLRGIEFGKNDPRAEWQGMPEFDQQDKTPFRSILVHFREQEHVEQFAELLGQQLTSKTKSIWFPEADGPESMCDKAYVVDGETDAQR